MYYLDGVSRRLSIDKLYLIHQQLAMLEVHVVVYLESGIHEKPNNTLSNNAYNDRLAAVLYVRDLISARNKYLYGLYSLYGSCSGHGCLYKLYFKYTHVGKQDA